TGHEREEFCSEMRFNTLAKDGTHLTDSLTNLSQSEWRMILERLRRARLLTAGDPQYPGQLDAHPLVREHFGEQLRSERAETWKECNKRLYGYYRTLAPQLPNSFREMEGITWIEQGIRDYRATGSVLGLPDQLARKAEALH